MTEVDWDQINQILGEVHEELQDPHLREFLEAIKNGEVSVDDERWTHTGRLIAGSLIFWASQDLKNAEAFPETELAQQMFDAAPKIIQWLFHLENPRMPVEYRQAYMGFITDPSQWHAPNGSAGLGRKFLFANHDQLSEEAKDKLHAFSRDFFFAMLIPEESA